MKNCITSFLNIPQSATPQDLALNGFTLLVESDRENVIWACHPSSSFGEEGVNLCSNMWSCILHQGCINTTIQESEKFIQMRRNQLQAVLFLPHASGSAGEDTRICPDRGRARPSKGKMHSCRSFPSCASKWMHNESNLIISLIINLTRMRWGSVKFVFDLEVCQAVMRGSVRWLFYPQPYVYTKLVPTDRTKGLWRDFWFFCWKSRNFGSFVLQLSVCSLSLGRLWVTKSTDRKQCRCSGVLEEMGSLQSAQSADAKWDSLLSRWLDMQKKINYFKKNDFIKKEKKPTTHTQKGMSSSYTRLKKKGS